MMRGTRHRSRVLNFAAASLALLVGTGEAQAHLVTTGVGPFYDGVAHFALTPEDLLPVMALAVLAALRGPTHGRPMLFALPALWLGGGIAGHFIEGKTNEILPAACFLAVGLLVAIDAPLPAWGSVAIAGIVAAILGYSDGSTLPADAQSLLILLGIVASVFTVFALAVALALPLRSRIARIAMRVSGSWVAAAGLLLLGWTLRTALRLST
jgi:urease accessory protein